MTTFKLTLPKIALVLLAGALLIAAFTLPSGANNGTNDDTAVAKVGDVTLTQADLEEFLKDQLQQIELQKAKLFEDGIGPLVEKTLLERKAKSEGVDVDDFLKTALESRTEPVTDASIDTWYEENKARVRGQTREAIGPQIRKFLEQTQESTARTSVIAELRKEYDVEIFLEPVRIAFTDEGATTKGPDDALVTIVEFSDFQCPACKGFNPTLTEVLKRYEKDVRVVFRQFPLRSIHPMAQKAAEAALCARDQDKFWDMHDSMFGDQRNLDIASLKNMAKEADLDTETFDACLDSGEYAPVVQADLNIGSKVGVSGTPAVFINGRVIAPGRVPSLIQMTSVIDEELLRAAKK